MMIKILITEEIKVLARQKAHNAWWLPWWTLGKKKKTNVAGQKTEMPIRHPCLCSKSLNPRERKGFVSTDKTSCPKTEGRGLQSIENKIS